MTRAGTPARSAGKAQPFRAGDLTYRFILLAVITDPGVAYSSGSGKLTKANLKTGRHRPRPAMAVVLMSSPGSAAAKSSRRRALHDGPNSAANAQRGRRPHIKVVFLKRADPPVRSRLSGHDVHHSPPIRRKMGDDGALF